MNRPTDTEMIEWLEEQNRKKAFTGKCVFRNSTTGRGWRLHETSDNEVRSVMGSWSSCYNTVREAITAAMLESGAINNKTRTNETQLDGHNI